MNGLLDSRFLNSARIQRIFEEAAAYLERNRPLVWLDRVQQVNARDDELLGRFTSKTYAAAIINEGSKAPVYKGGEIELVLNSLAKIKHGRKITERELSWLNDLTQRGGIAEQDDQYDRWIRGIGEHLLFGVRQRMNAMIAAMFVDSFDYNAFGVKIEGSVWGMPSALKVTPSALWSTDNGATVNASAVPFQNIQRMDTIDADNYGLGPFDRITMSSTAFDFMCSTTEFANKAFLKLSVAFAPALAALSTGDRAQMKPIAETILGKEIVIDDARYRVQGTDGSEATHRYLPANKVVLDRKSNGPAELDWGNGVIMESVVSALTGGVTLGANPKMDFSGTYGPLGYFTADQQLNPPEPIAWGVARGWPRRHRPECSAVLTVWEEA